jgi:hypothetical protein
MRTTITRIGLATAGLAAMLSLSAVPANAAAAQQTTSVAAAAPTTAASAVLRGWYWNYYDCDYAGFYGVYYGYWTGYFCNWSNSAQAWGLYA